MTALLAPALRNPEDDLATRLMESVTAEFLQLMSWDADLRVLFFPRDHVLFGAPGCLVPGCDKMAHHAGNRGLCRTCAKKQVASGATLNEFLTSTKTSWRSIGVVDCLVTDCPRPRKTFRNPLCHTHSYQQQKIYRLPVEEFIRHPEVRPLPSFGPCDVAACYRDRDGSGRYCAGHRGRLTFHRRRTDMPDEETWRLTTSAIAQHGVISLRGLPDLVVAETLYGLERRNNEGVKQKDFLLRPFIDHVRARQFASLTEVGLDAVAANSRRLAGGLIKHVLWFDASPETERHRVVWRGAVFGLTGTISFEKISQPWLRKATQDWAIDDIPRRRGNNPKGPVQRQINAIGLLSESLRLNRADRGADRRQLSRDDIVLFLNRLRFLHEQGEISAHHRIADARDARRLLNRMRTLGLTQPGQPLDGLPDSFGLREEDIPEDAEDDEAGRDLPPEVMRQLCANLDTLDPSESQHGRTTVEVVIDTGRRPSEICHLPWDCLERDGDGKPVLVYDNHKALRNGRRLPISEATAGVIVAQQERTRARFPGTPLSELALMPSVMANPDGMKPISTNWVGCLHREWVDSLPEFLVPTVVEIDGGRITKMLPFDKAKIFLYAYRHTYAQRHADAGVPVDVLKVLMDHRQLDTTQRYYRVGEERRREAIERVTAMQFDRHGNRVWRTAQAVLDSEHARRAVGQVSVPYGVCTEPSNVAAGGHDCPVRFRCVGCGHFRTDVSYLPDLDAYLADLLRNRERLAAFATADDWAKTEALPSDEEITRVRRLIERVRHDLDDLTDEDRAQIQEAITLVRRSRQVVSLGMPRIRQPLPDLRPERSS
ncbi:hypothetical protein ACFW9M_14960 [Streptomyces lydicus]|uniref:hypothetical protein n=1 Tax=Streptomyces lydicus TaxID=47763 RepID=UPI0036C923EB